MKKKGGSALLVLVLIATAIVIAGRCRRNFSLVDVDKDLLFSHVQYLTSIQPARNFYHVESLDDAANYIEKEFRKHTEQVEIQEYMVEDDRYQNVIASFGVKNAKRIIIGAHYDVCDEQPGADDNASGVAGLLELARLLAQIEPGLKCRVDLTAYTLEEPPCFKTQNMGSAVHARSLADRGARVDLMIALEMIGYYNDDPNTQKYPIDIMKHIYPDRGDFIAVVGRIQEWRPIFRLNRAIRKNASINTVTLTSPVVIPGIDNSDHLNFWKYNYPALMVTDTAFFRNENYHEESDTIDTLDFERMAEVVWGVYCFVRDI